MNPDEGKNGLGTGTKHPATNLRLVPPKPSKSTTIMPQCEASSQTELTCLYPEQLEAIDGIVDYTGLSRLEAVRMIVSLGLDALELGTVIEGGGGGDEDL